MDKADLVVQGGVVLIRTATDRTGREVLTDQQVQSVALWRQAEPTQVLLAAEVPMPERQPHRSVGGDRAAQRLHDSLDRGQIGMFARHTDVVRGVNLSHDGPPIVVVIPLPGQRSRGLGRYPADPLWFVRLKHITISCVSAPNDLDSYPWATTQYPTALSQG